MITLKRYSNLLDARTTVATARLDALLSSALDPSPCQSTNKADFQGFREADDGARTRDPWLGKPMLYQLSYVRLSGSTIAPPSGANDSSEGWPTTPVVTTI